MKKRYSILSAFAFAFSGIAFAQQSAYLGLTGNTVYIKSTAGTSAITTGIGTSESFSAGKGMVSANVNDVNYLYTATPLTGRLNIDMSGNSNYTAQAWNTSVGNASGSASHAVRGTYGTQGSGSYIGPGQTLDGAGWIDGGMFDKNNGMTASLFTPSNTGVGLSIGNVSTVKGFAVVDRVWPATNSSEKFNSNLSATILDNASRAWSTVQALFDNATTPALMSTVGVKASSSASNTTSIWFEGSDPSSK